MSRRSVGLARKASGDEPTLRIHQTIARDLGVAILSGRYKPGEIFTGEIESAAQLKVSRTAYREAARILTAKGLLESRPKAGTRVTPRERWNFLDPEILAWMFSGKPDPDFVRDLFELRTIIEPAAAAFAAERRTQSQAGEMAAALEIMRVETLSTSKGRAADQLFHKTILVAARNEPLAALASSVGAAVGWTTKFKLRQRTLARDSYPDHAKVFKAIAAQDVEGARNAMKALIQMALADMKIPPR